MIWRFESYPEPGTVLAIGDQQYVLLGVEPHRRQDGEMTRLLVWQAPCARCGVPFVCRSTLSISSLVRRCQTHKSPGHRPGGRRRGQPIGDTVTVTTPRHAGTPLPVKGT